MTSSQNSQPYNSHYSSRSPGALKLRIPRLVNFSCTNCASCCHQWPVPLTRADINYLCQHSGRTEGELGLNWFSGLKESTAAPEAKSDLVAGLPQNNDGRCIYLEDNKLCRLHGLRVEDRLLKPSMCQLFPLGYLDAPDGTTLCLSFASSAVLKNSGRPLSEQSEQLAAGYEVFQGLFPGLKEATVSGFANLEWLSGVPLSFSDFLAFEKPFLADLETALMASQGEGDYSSAEDILYKFLGQIQSKFPSVETLPGVEHSPNRLDQIFFFSLKKVFLPDAKFPETTKGEALPRYVKSGLETGIFAFVFNPVSLPEPSGRKVDELLLRFVYVKCFSRFYFGPGFSRLSLLAGLGHLFFLVVLLKQELAFRLGTGQATFEPLEEMAQMVRALDGQLTSLRYDSDTNAMLEIFALDHKRGDRILRRL